jgi:hypothetical protein
MILKDRFCNLSREANFQKFLKELAVDLYQDLIDHLQLGEGCQSNKKKMIQIYDEVKKRGSEARLVQFIEDNHPHMVIRSKTEENEAKPAKLAVKKMEALTLDDLYTKMNHHKVFDVYRPRVMFVPQRKIIVGPSREYVANETTKFIRTKTDVDYVILEGPELWHSYIEYFDQRFSKHAEKINKNKRPISVYKKRHGLK